MSELTVQYLVLERCDPARNMARFYVLTIEPTLFGDTALVREWGRLGQRGRRRLDLFVLLNRLIRDRRFFKQPAPKGLNDGSLERGSNANNVIGKGAWHGMFVRQRQPSHLDFWPNQMVAGQ